MTVEIAPLATQEVERLAELAREIWRAHYPPIIGSAQTEYMLAQRYEPDVIRRELAEPQIAWDTLKLDGRMIAFASSFPAEDSVKLDKLYVHQQHQRHGYGGMLIEHVRARARSLGHPCIVLAVNKHNTSAIRAYEKHGFRIVDALVKDIGGGFVMDDYVMRRSTAPA